MFLRHLFRAEFCIGLLTSSFWLGGFVFEQKFDQYPLFFALLFLIFAVFAVFFVFRGNFLLLAPSNRSVKILLKWLLYSYIGLVPLAACVAYLWVTLIGDSNAGDVSLAIILCALWFPIWIAPMVGAVLAHREMLGATQLNP